jgi:hypothetical protein
MKIGVPKEIKKAPKLLTRNMLASMRARSVVVDVAIDQGGCSETSHHATTHADPIYVLDHIVHYCVANIPAAVARTATFALTTATLPYILKLADRQYGATDVRRNGAISKVSLTTVGKRRWKRIHTCEMGSMSRTGKSSPTVYCGHHRTGTLNSILRDLHIIGSFIYNNAGVSIVGIKFI